MKKIGIMGIVDFLQAPRLQMKLMRKRWQNRGISCIDRMPDGPDDIEVEDDGYDLDDVICKGGNQFDIKLDKDLNEVSRGRMINESEGAMTKLFASVLALTLMVGAAAAETLPTIRAAVLKIGTVNWELETIRQNGLDRKHGFILEVQPSPTTAPRVSRSKGMRPIWPSPTGSGSRVKGRLARIMFSSPIPKPVGGVVVPADSPAQSLKDLAGGKIGIAGGPLDKSWLILCAYAAQEYGLDLKADTEQVFGAPPLIFKSALGGDYAGAINFWHFLAKMKASGMRELISVEQAGQALGLDTNTPLLGYYLKESFWMTTPILRKAFLPLAVMPRTCWQIRLTHGKPSDRA